MDWQLTLREKQILLSFCSPNGEIRRGAGRLLNRKCIIPSHNKDQNKNYGKLKHSYEIYLENVELMLKGSPDFQSPKKITFLQEDCHPEISYYWPRGGLRRRVKKNIVRPKAFTGKLGE
jgi:hypothetical protein